MSSAPRRRVLGCRLQVPNGNASPDGAMPQTVINDAHNRSSLFPRGKYSEALSYRDDSRCQPEYAVWWGAEVSRRGCIAVYPRRVLLACVGARLSWRAICFVCGVSGAILRPQLKRVERGACCRKIVGMVRFTCLPPRTPDHVGVFRLLLLRGGWLQISTFPGAPFPPLSCVAVFCVRFRCRRNKLFSVFRGGPFPVILGGLRLFCTSSSSRAIFWLPSRGKYTRCLPACVFFSWRGATWCVWSW